MVELADSYGLNKEGLVALLHASSVWNIKKYREYNWTVVDLSQYSKEKST